MLMNMDIPGESGGEIKERPPEEKKSILKIGTRFEFLFLAAFSLTASFIPNTVVLHVTKASVNPILTILFSTLAYLGFALCLSLYLKKGGSEAEGHIKGGKLNGMISSTAGVLLLYVITLLFALAYKSLLGMIPVLANLDTKAVSFLAGLAVSIILLLMLLFSAVVLLIAVFQYDIAMNGIGRIYRVIVKGMILSFFRVVYTSVFAGLLLYFVNFVQNMSLQILESFLQPGFFRNFIFYALGACINAGFFLVLITLSRRFLNKMEAEIVEVNSRPMKSPLPVFAIGLAVFCVVLTFLLGPVGGNRADGILAEAVLHQEKGDIAWNMGFSQKSIYEYDLAYSELLSLKGYLQGIKYIKEQTPKTLELSNLNMQEADRLSLKNPYVPYFRGQLLLQNSNPDGAIDAFKTAVLHKGGVVESYYGLLEAYKLKGQQVQINEVLQILDNTEVYSDGLVSLKKYSTGKIDGLLSKIEAVEESLGPKMVYKAVEKLKYNDTAGALNDLMALQKLYPKNPMISYQIARTANEFKNESANYATVIAFADAFDTQSENSGITEDKAGRKLFVAQMYQGANDYGAAEKILADAYAEYPDNLEIAQQYAYVLNLNNRPDESLKVLNAILTENPQDLEALALSADSQLTRKDAAESLKFMDRFVQSAGTDPKKNALLDRNLYTYCLAFHKTFPEAEIQAEIDRYQGNSLLYHYLNAIKGWKEHDAALSNSHMEKVIALRQDLGYAYYIMGVNYYEETVRTGGSDFSKAAAYYQESLKILPAHAEGYFALGHCYKKWGRNREALRAFRKVTDLMPYEDHRVDPYGMAAHAVIEVGALVQYDLKEVN